MNIGDRVPPITLRTADGAEVELGDYLDRVLLVQCLRYYG